MIPSGFQWNQAELESLHPLNDALISIIAFDDNRSPIPIGTGFIVAAYPDGAIGCTAAHNFIGVDLVQRPHKWHHPAALREFLPTAQPLDLDRRRLRAVHFSGSTVEMAVFGWAAWDDTSDVAVFSLLPQSPSAQRRFDAVFELDDAVPQVGAEVVALGYEGMAVNHRVQDGQFASFGFQRQLLVRAGRITGVYPSGFRLCKGRCVETSIPVFPGMSGGPVMIVGSGDAAMRPFGLISSDPFDDESSKLDRRIAGASIVPLIGARVSTNPAEQRETVLRLNDAMWAQNRELLELVLRDAQSGQQE